MNINDYHFGLYEKALPAHLSWTERMEMAKDAGYSFIEISIDESDERLERLQWDRAKRLELVAQQRESGIRLQNMCLSGHRRYPIGTTDLDIQLIGMKLMSDAIDFAVDTGIRVIQLAGYDAAVGEESTAVTAANFARNLATSVEYAASRGVVLAIENMGVLFMDSVSKAMKYVDSINSPYLQVYPDIGNIDAMNHVIDSELKAGAGHIVGIHIKDTMEGIVRRIPFGEGRVDFVSAFKSIKSIGYGGPLLVEMWADDRPGSCDEITQAKKWIEEKMHLAWEL